MSSSPLKFPSRAALILMAAICASAPANAAFETWLFPGAALPFRLEDVTFSRDDRREAVVETIRDMARRQLQASGLFRNGAAEHVIIDLRDVETAATVTPDGEGIGRASILYRVRNTQGRVLFNDRITTESRVTVRESIPLQQSTQRAARYRAFTLNLDAFGRQFWRIATTFDALPDARIDRIVLDRSLETPERTADFAERIRAALEIQAPMSRAATAEPLELRVTAVSFRETTPPMAETVGGEARLSLTAYDANGGIVWQSDVAGTARIDRRTALLSGLSPIDAALATATQSAVQRTAPELGAAVAENKRLRAVAARHHRPFRLEGIDAGATPGDGGALARLRAWNRPGQPLASSWNATGTPSRLRIDSPSMHLKKTAPGKGIAETSAAYSATDSEGRVLLMTRQKTQAPFSTADARLRGTSPGEWALRVGLRDSWNGLLDEIAILGAPLAAKDDSASTR